MVTIKDLTNNYQGRTVLDHVNFSMRQGDFLSLFGPDDAGKTTLLHILMGFQTKYSGTAQIFGKDANSWSVEDRRKVRFVSDNILWEQGMTAEDYFRFAKAAAPAYDEQLQAKLCSEFEISLKDGLLDLTYQENKFVQIAAAVCARPKLLILDEPMNFLDTDGWCRLLDKLQEWNKSGMSIFLAVEQFIHVGKYAQSYGYLKEGKLVSSGKVLPSDKRWKVITVMGKVPVEFQNAMDQCIAKKKYSTSYLYTGIISELTKALHLLGELDYRIEDVTLEEELESDFSRWE